MKEIVLTFGFFLFGYVINMFYISVLYHRGLTHQSIIMGPKLMKVLGLTGGWLTGLDPKSWACMHRLHHKYSDTTQDPHSPTHQGVMGVWIGQYKSYINIQKALMAKKPEITNVVADIPFDVGFVNRRNLSWVPYLLHIGIGFALYSFFGSFWIGLGYFFGIMSHPLQGWMVNALAHKYGGRNFNSEDDSRNNHFVALVAFGEGFQNNHHTYPERAKFSVKWYEFDPGYVLCVMAETLGVFKISRAKNVDY